MKELIVIHHKLHIIHYAQYNVVTMFDLVKYENVL